MKNDVQLVGESMEGTQLGSTTGFYIIRFNSVSNGGVSNLRIENNGGQVATPSIYVYGASPTNIDINKIHFTGNTGYATIISPTTGYADRMKVLDCLCDSSTIAYYLYGGNIRQSHFLRNHVQDCTSTAFYIKGLTDSEISDNVLIDAVENLYNGAIVINNTAASRSFSIVDNKFRFTANPPNTVNGIVISGEASDSIYDEVYSIRGNKLAVEAAVTANLNTFIYTHGDSSGAHTVRHGTISDNTMKAEGTINYGIVLTQTDHTTAYGNIIDTVEKNGILVADSDYTKMFGNKVRNWDQEAGGNTAIDLTSSPTNVVGDGSVQSYIPVDISSGSADTQFLLSPEQNVCLLNAYLKYTEGSGAGNCLVTIGKESDVDYYYTGNTENSKAQWYTKTLTLLKRDLDAGDTLIFSSANNAGDAGEIICVVDYAFID
jgi:hypothetical protein